MDSAIKFAPLENEFCYSNVRLSPCFLAKLYASHTSLWLRPPDTWLTRTYLFSLVKKSTLRARRIFVESGKRKTYSSCRLSIHPIAAPVKRLLRRRKHKDECIKSDTESYVLGARQSHVHMVTPFIPTQCLHRDYLGFSSAQECRG
jgi:hypothetical protein